MYNYDFVYELMRAYRESSLLINKRVIGGKVKEFLDIPGSYKQIVVDEKGNKSYYQYIEFSVPSRYKSEKKIEKYLKGLEEKYFKGKLLYISDEEIERFNRYWELEFIGLVEKLNKGGALVEKPDGEKICVSLRKGKRVPDVFEILFKPLAYF